MIRILEPCTEEITVQKSRFIALLFPLKEKEEARRILEQIRKEHPKATHVCYGYTFDGSGKSNDDGEPSGTAGRPILETLLKNGFDRAALIVVRYFGGIKLGAGGLTRAYVEAASSVIRKAEWYSPKKRLRARLLVPYAENDALNRYLSDSGIDILETSYGEEVTYTVSCERGELERLNDRLCGRIRTTVLNEMEVLVKTNKENEKNGQ